MSVTGSRIKKLRYEKDISQKELSKALGILNTTLSQYETGKRAPSDDIKMDIADYFDVSVDYLIGRDAGGTDKRPHNKRRLMSALDIVLERHGITGADEDLAEDDLEWLVELIDKAIEFSEIRRR